jgi:hypothetical protein
LDQKALQNLRSDTLEKAEETLMLHNKSHDLAKALERLALARWRRLRLQANLGDNQGLGGDGSHHL